MAMTYQNFASLGVNLNRQKYGPLDISNVFTSAADLKYYLTKGTFTDGVSEYWYKNANEKIVPYPYEGQVLATVIDGVVNVYALSLDVDGNFQTQEIAGKIEVDGNTIKLNAEGKLELVGLDTVEEGKTYVPSLVNGKLVWAEPDTSTAEGQAQEINALKVRAEALETTVNGKAAVGEEGAEDYIPAIEGLVAKVAANAQAIVDEASARDDADKALEGKIAEALQAAKDYADENDANTVYDDTALAARVKAIEDDYLVEADKYDDTALAGRVSALETAVGDAENGLIKDLADEVARASEAERLLGERIDAIDFIDEDELSEAIKNFATAAYVDGEIDKIEEAIAGLNHFKAEVVDSVYKVTEVGILYLIKDETVAGADKYNEYIVIDGVATLIGDTTTDLANYYNKTEIDGKVESIEQAIADEVEARGELANKVAALEAVDNATQAELDAYKLEVTSAIATAKSEAIADADGKLADKLDVSAFDSFKTENTTAIATAKQEAIDAAKAAEEAKGYAVATEVAATYATKAALETHEQEIENELLAYAKTADVNVELAKKIESGAIAHSSESLAEGVTVDGTKLNIVVDAYTKAETRDYVAEVIRDMTGGESAADVLRDLNAHIATYSEKVGQIDAKNAAQDLAIEAAQTQADKGVADAAKVAGDLAALDARVVSNTNELAAVKGTITTVNETLSGKIANLEAKDTELAGLITGLDTVVKSHGETIGQHTAAITTLENKDVELAAAIQANTDKFADYYTAAQVDAKVKTVSDAVEAIDLTPFAKSADVDTALALKANVADVYTKAEADKEFMTESEVDARINALIAAADPEGGKTIADIQNLVKYVDENAGEIASLVTATSANTDKLAGIETTVAAYIDSKIAAIVTPKASTEITVADDGTLGIGEVSTDKLVMGTKTLIISGGNAEISANE